ncbi:MAG: RluA family pseudouridine synthase [Gammaproteobacteria bacterium]|nr:RluA family pseudouridine synthase [Gammaproteobacteria bacterium]
MAQSRQPTGGVRHLRIGADAAGQRLDNFLIRQLPGVPKSHVYRLLRSGQVRVDGARVKPARRLSEGESVRLPPVRLAERGAPVRPPDAVLQRLRSAVIHEDAHYLAIDKPAGLAAHGGSGLAFGVIEAVRAWERHPYIELCHRLDRDTSGVLLLAKTRPALLRAQAAFRDGAADKRYLALLCGAWHGGAREVDAALVKERLVSGERMVGIDDEGKSARSRFSPQQRFVGATLCEVEIFSGRTHQIRVHAVALGHPVAGDRKYGGREQQVPWRALGLRRMFLHAHRLQLPANAGFLPLLLHAPLPQALRTFVDRLSALHR